MYIHHPTLRTRCIYHLISFFVFPRTIFKMAHYTPASPQSSANSSSERSRYGSTSCNPPWLARSRMRQSYRIQKGDALVLGIHNTVSIYTHTLRRQNLFRYSYLSSSGLEFTIKCSAISEDPCTDTNTYNVFRFQCLGFDELQPNK